MKVTTQGTTHSVKWYQPESADECKGTDCRKCVYYSYIPSSASCPFEAWMIKHPVEKPAPADRSEMARVLLAKHWGLFPSRATRGFLCSITEEEQDIELSDVVDALTEINQSIIKLCEILQEQPTPKSTRDRTWPFPDTRFKGSVAK